ncbi:substrate-binding periplasmic protein (plasmid) [Vibrio tubiashii]|uniref:substrate-binding periplasmic protein n=1 Tax=Vibrio tubiashii TaxID=29498 RepID=UPI003CE5ABF5
MSLSAIVYISIKTHGLDMYYYSKLIALACLFLAVSTVDAKTIHYATLEYCPYACNSEQEGFALTLHRRIFEEAGYEVTFSFVPWTRVIKGVESGLFDATPILNQHHSELIVLSKENSTVLQQYFFVAKGNTWKFSDVTDLQSIVIGSIFGYDYGVINQEYEDHLQRNKDNLRVQYIGGPNAIERSIKKIITGRIGTFNEDAGYMFHTLREMALTDKIDEAGFLGTNPQFGGFSPTREDAQALADIFDRGIRRMRASGELRQLLDEYGIPDWVE